MKKQLQGIALILFGILLSVAGSSLNVIFEEEVALVAVIIGFVIGLVGLFAAFNGAPEQDQH